MRGAAGFSAKAEPTHMEAMLATEARAAAMPAAVRDRKNPVAASPEVIHEAMAHYADHCAVCHGNDGSGDTMMGKGMYPKPPDMRLPATQGKTDGELFSVIENGVRLSGMPAFGGTGDAASELESWKLVAFLRHLPAMDAAEAQGLAGMTPRTPAEMEEEKQEADFLNGGEDAAADTTSKKRNK